MRRMLVFVGAVAVFAVPAAARADLLTTYQEIAARRLSPAPLVPTTLPRTLSPARRTVGPAPTRKPNRSYAVRVVHYSGSGPDAVILVTGGELKTLRATLRDYRTLGFASKRRTRVRGHRGWLLTHRGERALAWVERGVVYTVGSGTPKKVSLTQLRATARGLDRLERDWLGTTSNPDSSSEAFAVTTAHTVSLDVSFEANCTSGLRVGQATVTLLRRQGNAFSFDIASHRKTDDPWNGTVTGTIAPDAITLQVHATGTIQGEACDTGDQTLTLDQRER